MSINSKFFSSGFNSWENYKRFEKDPITAAAAEAAEQVRDLVDKVIDQNPAIDRKVLVSRILCVIPHTVMEEDK